MDEVTKNLQSYEQGAPTAEKTIRDTITDAYGNLRPELEAIHHYETQQMPSFYDAFSGYGMGTGATDLDPLSRLQHASRNVGRQSALARTSRDVFDVRRNRMEDLIGSAYKQYQTGHRGAESAYQRAFQQMQFEEQQRQFNAQLAQSGRASGGVDASTWEALVNAIQGGQGANPHPRYDRNRGLPYSPQQQHHGPWTPEHMASQGIDTSYRGRKI